MRRIICFALTLLLCGSIVSPAQNVIAGTHRKVLASGGTTPAYKSYAYAAEGTSVTNSITVASGDIVYVFCSSYGTSVTGITPSTSGTAGTWYNAGLQSASSGSWELFQTVMAASGSVTFTCSFTGSYSYQSVVAMDFSSSGSTTVNTTATGTGSTGTITASSITTSARTLTVMCGRAQSGAHNWTASTINGSTATLGGISASSLGGNGDAGCEYYVLTASASGFPAVIINAGSTSGASFMANTY